MLQSVSFTEKICLLPVAMVTLAGELVPDVNPLAGSTTFRKSIALGMFYKVCILLKFNLLSMKKFQRHVYEIELLKS